MKDLSPQNNTSVSLPSCFIKFQVTDQGRFQILTSAFEILKQEKIKYLETFFDDKEEVKQENAANEQDMQEFHEQTLLNLMEACFDMFDEQALAYFWWPSKQENQDYWQRWNATQVEQRFTDPKLNTPWDFESMIDCLLNGEYELTSCRLLTPDTGVLEFIPFSFPYGGTGCMKAFVEAFDCQVSGEDNGTGYVSYLADNL